MNSDIFSQFLSHRSAILSTGQINLDRLYTNYTVFCESKGLTPEPYEKVETQLSHDIYATKLWWSGIAPHVGQSVLGVYVLAELNEACEVR